VHEQSRERALGRDVKWILRYLKESSDMALCYDDMDVRMHGYVNSDFASDVDSQKSTTGYVFTLRSGAVSSVLRLQKVVTLSTTEAEYVAVIEACKELLKDGVCYHWSRYTRVRI